jgi:signal transduction histidine kinase
LFDAGGDGGQLELVSRERAPGHRGRNDRTANISEFICGMKPSNEAQAMDRQGRDFTRSAEIPATAPRSMNSGSKPGHKGVLAWSERGAVDVTDRELDGRQRREHERIEAGDRERERLGRELHDGLCQNLAGIAALSATLARKLAARNDPAQAAAAEITVLLQQTIGDARDLARGLNAGGVAQMGLATALEALAGNVEALHAITCAFACDRDFPRLDPTVEAHLYRIAQQAVSNAVGHGRGRRIGISLRLRGGEARLQIRDNGVGIPRGAGGVAGMGLDTMDYRARLIGARLQVRRVAPRGTLVACTFPLPPPPAKERRDAGNLP